MLKEVEELLLTASWDAKGSKPEGKAAT